MVTQQVSSSSAVFPFAVNVQVWRHLLVIKNFLKIVNEEILN